MKIVPAKENQVAAGENFGRGADEKVLENSPKAVEPINTRIELAKIAGVSDNTIAKVKRSFALCRSGRAGCGGGASLPV